MAVPRAAPLRQAAGEDLATLTSAAVIQEHELDRVAVIGDIHGRLDLLDALLARLGDIPIVSAGDVCDRGDDTRGVIDRLMEREALGVRGNHEEWLIRWASGDGFDDFALSPAMGGSATLASYDVDPMGSIGDIEEQHVRVPLAQRRWLAGLPLALSLRVAGHRYWVVHAGLPPRFRIPKTLDPQYRVAWLCANHPQMMTWAKMHPEACIRTDGTVIMGHVPLPKPIDADHVIAVDTGAGTWGPQGALTAIVLPERVFISVR